MTADHTRALVFHMAGPMESWGGIAVGTVRPTRRHPTKSAIVGIISASLGLERDDERILRLYSDYEYAVISAGIESEISDYATVETTADYNGELRSALPPRSLELYTSSISGSNGNNLVVDKRYICNGYFTVIVLPKNGAIFDLEIIKNRLDHPIFTPYLGRKSCPLMFPMCPTIEQCEHVRDLIMSVYLKPFRENSMQSRDLINKSTKLMVYSTYNIEGYDGSVQSVVADEIIDRIGWQFKGRMEYEYLEEPE